MCLLISLIGFRLKKAYQLAGLLTLLSIAFTSKDKFRGITDVSQLLHALYWLLNSRPSAPFLQFGFLRGNIKDKKQGYWRNIERNLPPKIKSSRVR